jgi:hypothetical protein
MNGPGSCPKTDLTRLAKLLGMTGSAHEGEVVNAARKAGKLLAGLGITWEQALTGQALTGTTGDGAGGPDSPAWQSGYVVGYQDARQDALDFAHAELRDKTRDALRTARQEARQEGYQDGYLQGLQDGQAAPRTRIASWRACANAMLERSNALTPWEIEFCQGFLDRKWHRPSERMRTVFGRIAEKLGLELPE